MEVEWLLRLLHLFIWLIREIKVTSIRMMYIKLCGSPTFYFLFSLFFIENTHVQEDSSAERLKLERSPKKKKKKRRVKLTLSNLMGCTWGHVTLASRSPLSQGQQRTCPPENMRSPRPTHPSSKSIRAEINAKLRANPTYYSRLVSPIRTWWNQPEDHDDGGQD